MKLIFAIVVCALVSASPQTVAAQSSLKKQVGPCPKQGVERDVCELATSVTPERIRLVVGAGNKALQPIKRLLDSVDASWGKNRSMIWGLGQALTQLGTPGWRLIANYVAQDAPRRNSGWHMIKQLAQGAAHNGPSATKMPVGRWHKEVCPMFIALLADRRPKVRAGAIAAVGFAGKRAKPLGARVLAHFDQHPAAVSRTLARSIEPGSALAHKLGPKIASVLGQKRPRVGSIVLRALGRLRALPHDKMATLLLGLVRNNKRLHNNIGGRQNVAWQTAMAFKLYGTAVRGPLQKALTDNSSAVRCAAMRAMSGGLGSPKGRPLVYGPMRLDRNVTKLMAKLMMSPQKCLALGALHILVNENYGPAIPVVVKLLDSAPDTAVRLMRHYQAFRGVQTIRGRAHWQRKILPTGAELGRAVKAELKRWRYKVHKGFGKKRPWRYRLPSH